MHFMYNLQYQNRGRQISKGLELSPRCRGYRPVRNTQGDQTALRRHLHPGTSEGIPRPHHTSTTASDIRSRDLLTRPKSN